MTRQFSPEELRMLVELNQAMDAGTQPFVIFSGGRLAVTSEAIEHFGFKQGQTIDTAIFEALMLFNIARCEAKIAEQEDDILAAGEIA